jgi:hypothetical protein
LDLDFVQPSIVPTLGLLVDYLWGKAPSSDGVVAIERGRG